ncbi:hypothetical protein MRX96_011476 [Rhipicephalus microplus]
MEGTFVVDEVSAIIKEAMETIIGGNVYQHSKGAPYIVTCVIMEKNGAGLHTATSCYWDNTTDGSCTVRWENKTMYCIVSVFGLAI